MAKKVGIFTIPNHMKNKVFIAIPYVYIVAGP